MSMDLLEELLAQFTRQVESYKHVAELTGAPDEEVKDELKRMREHYLAEAEKARNIKRRPAPRAPASSSGIGTGTSVVAAPKAKAKKSSGVKPYFGNSTENLTRIFVAREDNKTDWTAVRVELSKHVKEGSWKCHQGCPNTVVAGGIKARNFILTTDGEAPLHVRVFPEDPESGDGEDVPYFIQVATASAAEAEEQDVSAAEPSGGEEGEREGEGESESEAQSESEPVASSPSLRASARARKRPSEAVAATEAEASSAGKAAPGARRSKPTVAPATATSQAATSSKAKVRRR